MTTKERLLAAIRCQEVDYVPLSMHFWHGPWHARANWHNERERLTRYREWEWDTAVGLASHVSPSKEVRVEVRHEDDGAVLRQIWHTPAGALEERLKVTDDWEAAKNITTYLPIYDDFRSPRYLEVMIKTADDLPKLEYLFPQENPTDTDAMARQHRRARALADELQVPMSVNHPAGMDWLTWLYSANGAVMEALDNRPVIERVLKIINDAYARRLEFALELGVDMVERRGWYESADFWNPSLFETLAKPILEPEIEATHRAGALHVYLMDTGVVPLLPILASLPFDCLHGVEPVYTDLDQRELRRRLPGKSIWGGISGPENLGRGTPESVERAVDKAFADYGKIGFILGMAVGIRCNWPEENLAACERAWRRLRS
jgi:uroporphyrinogen-III decarboxylase